MVDKNLKELLDKIKKSPLRPHAEEIGMICVLWGHLEMQIDVLLVALLNTDEKSASVILTGMGFREKIKAVRLLGFQKSPSDDWYKQLNKCAIKIDETLRPKRNRYIHDYWLSGSNKVLQIQPNAKLYRPQSRHFAIRYQHISETPISRLTVFQVLVLSEAGRLMSLTYDLYASDVPTPLYDTAE